MIASLSARRASAVLAATGLLALVGACGSANTTGSTSGSGAAGTATTTGGASSATAASAAITLKNCGETVSLPRPAQRAVTTEQSSTEMLLALGAADRIAGTSNLKTKVAPQYAEDYAKLTVITPKILTPEQTLSVNPDLVVSPFASILTKDRTGTRADLAAKGVASYVSETDCPAGTGTIKDPIEAVFADYRNLGALLGAERRAGELIAEQRKVVAAVAARKPTGAAPKLLWIYATFTGAPYAAGGTGLAQAMTERAGGVNVLADVNDSWPEVSWERIGASDPDLIVVADLSERGKPGDAAAAKIADLRSNPATAKLRAVAEGRILTVPGVEMDASVRFTHALQAVSDELARRGAVR